MIVTQSGEVPPLCNGHSPLGDYALAGTYQGHDYYAQVSGDEYFTIFWEAEIGWFVAPTSEFEAHEPGSIFDLHGWYWEGVPVSGNYNVWNGADGTLDVTEV